MERWEGLLKEENAGCMEAIKKNAEAHFDEFQVYASSIHRLGDSVFFIANQETGKALVIYGSKEYFPVFSGTERKVQDMDVKICPQSHENCMQVRTLFPYLNPVSHGSRRFSFGLGDRLGIATPGQIRAIKELDVFPILAQQSVRELTLTGRTFESVLEDACWGVFQEGYTKGFGADADHLKTDEEVETGLRSGYTMITLDCSEYIDNGHFNMDAEQLRQSYERIAETKRRGYEAEYLGSPFHIDGHTIEFSKTELMRLVLVYGQALDFIGHIYFDIIVKSGKSVDFEVSIDETTVPTSPEAHFFIASELKKMNVCPTSVAPRFRGEFQKGIDYIGDTGEFEKEFIIHETFARFFGYRLSIHSGSDKFRVFPVIGEYTKQNVHVKTAGTNWLEAVRLIAAKDPALYRRMHEFALSRLEEAKKYYHISAKPENIPDIGKLDDSELSGLMDRDDSRQALHIAYGLLLNEKDGSGKYVFRDGIYHTLYKHESDYYGNLQKHIGRHLEALGVR